MMYATLFLLIATVPKIVSPDCYEPGQSFTRILAMGLNKPEITKHGSPIFSDSKKSERLYEVAEAGNHCKTFMKTDIFFRNAMVAPPKAVANRFNSTHLILVYEYGSFQNYSTRITGSKFYNYVVSYPGCQFKFRDISSEDKITLHNVDFVTK